MIIASMATVPWRQEVAFAAVDSLLPQVDRLNIALDGFEMTPAWALDRRKAAPKGKIALWDFSESIGDGAKFFWADRLHKGNLHLVCDDDILYPPDYAMRMEKAAARWPKSAVGVHGIVLDIPKVDANGYYAGRAKTHSYNGRLLEDHRVHVLGTGTLAYRVGDIELNFEHFRWRPNVADLLFARTCLEQGVPMAAIARERAWLQPLRTPGESIYQASVAQNGSELDASRDADAIARTTRWPDIPVEG